MKIIKLLSVFFAMVLSMNVAGKDVSHKTYLFGFAASFKDSTVYITDIQVIDSAYINKTGFLFGRDNYSFQFGHYLQSKGVLNATTTTIFSDEQKKIEKKYLSLKKKYVKEGRFDIKYVQQNSFKYIGIVPQANDLKAEKAAKEKSKAEKKKQGSHRDSQVRNKRLEGQENSPNRQLQNNRGQ